ncbi:MAG: Ig-like domain-containing protein [Myxococcaceae bacterium]|nr:Ig-like domain-containing protein [Myxococcaceae bacterium]
MKVISRSSSLFGVLATALLAACPPPVNLPDGGDDNSIVVGPEGGLFIRNGYAMDVPRGAVTMETSIFITRIDTGVPDITDRKRISFGYRFSPTNLRFATPVKIYLTWEKDRLVKGVDPGTWDMRRQFGNESFQNPMPGSRTNMMPFEAVEAPTDRLGLFWVTSPTVPNIDRLEVSPDMETMRVGEMRTFSARVVAPSGDTIETPVTWTIVPGRVARVDPMGVVTALDPGQATLTATAGMKSATAKITVIREPALPGPATAAHDNPFPTGNDLWGGGLAPGGLGTIFVGENGTVLARSAADQWQRLFSSPGVSLRAVAGTTPTNAIAVGVSGSTGVAIEFRGTMAPRVRLFQTNSISELTTIWFDGTHGMAAGTGNNLIAYRNRAWVEENNPTLRRVMSIIGDGRGAFSVVNELGSIYRYDPARRVWDSLYDRELAVLLTTGKIVDTTTGESWAVGGGRLWHFVNGAWSATNLPSALVNAQFTAADVFDHRLFLTGTRSGQALIVAYDLRTVAPPADGGVPPDAGLQTDAGATDAGATDAGATDAGVEVDAGIDPDAGTTDAGVELDGGIDPDAGVPDAGPGPTPDAGMNPPMIAWAEFTMRGPQQPRGVFGGGLTSTTGYVVGTFGAVWEWNTASASFVERSRGFYGDVADIAATPSDVFVSVNECANPACTTRTGRVMHVGPTGWEVLGAPQPFSDPVFAIVAREGQEVIVSTQSAVYRWDQSQWSQVPVNIAGPIRDLKWCGSLLVGAGDNAAAYTGTASQLAFSQLTDAMGDAYAVSCPSQNEIWVAGDEYLAQRVNMQWVPRTSMMVQHGPWRTLYAPGGGEAWAYGDARFGVYWNTASLSALESFPIPMDIATASWGTSVDNLYMVGYTNPPVRFGFMMRFDGSSWRLIDSGSQRRVTAVDGFVTGSGATQQTTLWLGTLGGGVLKSVQP